MKNTAFSFHNSDAPESPPVSGVSAVSVPRKMLERYGKAWLLESKIRQLSTDTLGNRTFLLTKLLWYLDQENIESCDRMAIRGFLAYISETHKQEGGNNTLRWGNKQCSKKVRAGTMATYHRVLRALFNWIVVEAGLSASPMENVAAPVDRPDDILPFTEEQVNDLLEAARKSSHPRRDEAIVLFLLDTGVRVSELCKITMGDIDFESFRARVDGKGAKKRTVKFGLRTNKAIWKYLAEEGEERASHSHLFQADKGPLAGQGLTDSGVQQLLRRLGKVAHIQQARVSPHTFRHTFAVMYLRNRGNQYSLMQLLGHTNTKMTSRYVQFAEADIDEQHRRASPVDNMRRRR